MCVISCSLTQESPLPLSAFWVFSSYSCSLITNSSFSLSICSFSLSIVSLLFFSFSSCCLLEREILLETSEVRFLTAEPNRVEGWKLEGWKRGCLQIAQELSEPKQNPRMVWYHQNGVDNLHFSIQVPSQCYKSPKEL